MDKPNLAAWPQNAWPSAAPAEPDPALSAGNSAAVVAARKVDSVGCVEKRGERSVESEGSPCHDNNANEGDICSSSADALAISATQGEQ